MNIKGFIGAMVAGVIGALVWGAISYFTGYEIGYVAWGIGLLVGLGAVFVGGTSATNGVLCGVVALLSILGGKYLAVKFVVDKELSKAALSTFEEYHADASDYEEIATDEQLRDFMANHEYAASAADVTAEEMEDFRATTGPLLEEIRDGSATSENWLDTAAGKEWTAAVESLVSIPAAVKEGLGPMDILFGFLGIATAFKVGSGAGRE